MESAISRDGDVGRATGLGEQLCRRAVTPGLHSVPSRGTEYHGRVTRDIIKAHVCHRTLH